MTLRSPSGEFDDTVTQPGRAPLETTKPAGRPPSDWGAATSIGLVRQANEDRWIHIGSNAFAVADGMGGHSGGELAAATAVEAFVAIVGGDAALSNGEQPFHEINRQVRAALHQAGFDGGGSTLSSVVLDADAVSVINIGDSRVLRLRNGSLDQLTTDHTLRAEMRESGLSVPGSDRMRNALTSYLGIAPDLLRVDMVVHDVRPGDSYLLCSDGVHGQVSITAIADILSNGKSAADAANSLVRAADRAGGRDNATAVVLRF